MNGFIISIGCYITALSDTPKKIAKEIGVVTVNAGDTDCRVPDAIVYINTVIALGK